MHKVNELDAMTRKTHSDHVTLRRLLVWKRPCCLVLCGCVLLLLLLTLHSGPPEFVVDMGNKLMGTKDLEWWQTTVIYQIYPRSFCDSDGTGIGDLKGIISKLDHFTYLNIGAIWLSPFYKSPMKDFGYDVSDFRNVDPMFGTLSDFDELIKQAHLKGLKIIIDFVPNHSSDQHEWFQKSCKREDPYTDYYIWHDGKRDKDGKPQPPNNWLSVFGGPAWAWHEGRGQFYYRAFLAEQPDLNYWNPRIVEEMKDVLRFWLDRGVDGVRVDALEQLFEAKHLLNEPRNNEGNFSPFEHHYLKHIYTRAQEETKGVVLGWREVMDQYQKKDGRTRYMVIETYRKSPSRNRFYSYGGNPFNHDFVRMKAPLSGTQIKSLVEQEYLNLPDYGWPTFVMGNHDNKRVSFRYGDIYVDVLNMLLLTLKGTPCTYYGEELGMENIELTYEQTIDPWGKNFGPERYKQFSRDPERSPMQWNDSVNAGFTSASPWLPVHPSYATRNVKAQQKNEQQTSLQLYASVARLRQEPAFQKGELFFSVTDDNIVSYVRQRKASFTSRYLVILNVGQERYKNDFSASPVGSESGEVVEASCSLAKEWKGKEVSLTNLELMPGDGLIIRLH